LGKELGGKNREKTTTEDEGKKGYWKGRRQNSVADTNGKREHVVENRKDYLSGGLFDGIENGKEKENSPPQKGGRLI